MATTKKTKVGSLLSKVGSAIKSTVSSIASKVGIGSQTASAAKSMTFPVGAGLTPAQTVTANKLVGISPKTPVYNSQTIPLLSTNGALNPDIAGGGKNYTVTSSSKSSPSTSTSSPYFNPANYASTINTLSSAFGGTSAPTNAGNISLGTGGTGNLPIKDDYFTNNLDADSYTAGDEKTSLAQDKYMNDYYTQKYNEEVTRQKEEKSWIKDLLDSRQSKDEMRTDFMAENELQSFKEFQALKTGKRAEIASIQEKYNQAEQLMNQQIAQETSRFGLQDFTNNRIAQIKQAAYADLNYYSAQINSKTAELSAMNDDWEQAYNFIRDAVDDKYRDQQDKIDLSMELYDREKDMFKSLGDIKEKAYLEAIELAQKDLDYKKELEIYEKKLKLEQQYKNGSQVKSESYFIRSGEDLWTIADKFGLPYEAVKNANPQIKNERNIKIGSVINIPTESAGGEKLKTTELEQEIWKQIATEDFQNLSSKEKREFIQYNGGNPEDYGY